MLRAAVLGLGRIGQGYDFDLDGADGPVLTHARAFARHEAFELIAGVDPDPSQRERFSARYRAPAHASLGELSGEVDVVAVASPAEHHLAGVEQALALSPRAIIAEKPLAATAADGERIVAACRDAGCALLVNYMRRFEPATARLRDELAGGLIGEIRAGAGWYPLGLLENGSHLVDLVAWLAGPIESARVLVADPDKPAIRVNTASAAIDLLPTPAGTLNVFQLELLGTEGSLRYLQSGLTYSVQRPVTDRRLSHVTVLDAAAPVEPTDLPRYGLHVLDALLSHLETGSPLASDGDSALATLRICEELLADG